MEVIASAQVSTPVACLRLITTLPVGFVFAIVESSGTVLLSGQSEGTKVVPPERGATLERKELDRGAMHIEETRYGSRHVIWWSYRSDELPEDAEDTDTRSASSILAELLSRHGGNETATLRQNLSGIIGYANSVAKREGVHSSASLYAFFRSRFAAKRPLSDHLVDDPDFNVWLQKRAEELGD